VSDVRPPPDAASPPPDADSASEKIESSFVAETLRLNRRYLEEVVIGWNLCPWAARAWRAGQVVRRVLLEEALEVASVLAFIDALCARAGFAIGLAIFPRASVTGAGFGTFAERVRRADRARRPPEQPAPFLLAAFHPDLGAGLDAPNAAQLVSFIRRTPDPTLQLVRATLVEDLSPAGRDLSAEIARDNLAAVTARGSGALGALLDDIRRDRARRDRWPR
jgi:hypothetical protein